MKKMMLIVSVFLICVTMVGTALAAGCGNQHYFDCGGGVTNAGVELHRPGSSQKFKCYEHNNYTKKVACTTPGCVKTVVETWHSYKCMICQYGARQYETYYKTVSTTHSKSH